MGISCSEPKAFLFCEGHSHNPHGVIAPLLVPGVYEILK
jgi:hypothetical protein